MFFSLRLRLLLPFLAALITPLAASEPGDTATEAAAGPAAAVVDASYTLRANDVIRLDVYQEPDLSVAVRILKTGEASFPLIGTVKLAGTTVAAAAEKIRSLYAADFLVDPKLTITVHEYATEFISVIGAVRTPGQIPIPVSGNIDLAAAMATVGGLSETADDNGIDLIRADGSRSTHSINAIVSGQSGRLQLRAGDRVIVRQSPFVGKTVTILGQVGRQGPLAFPLSGRLDLVTAIAAAGGLSNIANPRKITVNRGGNIIQVDYREVSQRADKPFLLQPGDIVTVPERLF